MNAADQEKFFKSFTDAMGNILLKKRNDYAKEDVLSNFKEVGHILNMPPEKVALTLMGVKISRLGTLLQGGIVAQNESVQDSVMDLANYCFLLASLIEDGRINYEREQRV